MENFLKYLKENYISFKKISDNIVEINKETYQLIYPENGVIFDELFEFVCDDTNEDHYIFEFGDKWYYSPKGSETNPQLNLVKYLGKATITEPFIPWLGVHGKYEVLNGSRGYSDWCKKANFFSTPILGLCELNTLAGVIQFQEDCQKVNIKSVIGATYIVKNLKSDLQYRVKVYVQNETGWDNILKINKSVKVDNYDFIPEKEFWNLLEGLIVVLDPKYIKFDDTCEDWEDVENIYYQLDTVRYDDHNSDKEYLENLGFFIQSNFKPILIQDSYYLDKEDYFIKSKLNNISGVREFKSHNQYLKSFDEIFDELDEIFDEESKTFEVLLQKSLDNLLKVTKLCDFKVGVGKRYLPKYLMDNIEKKCFGDNRELFDHIIEEGFREKVPIDKEKEYEDRLNNEIEVIEFGDVVDYFLILWDIVNWCNKNNILVGIGRGSAGGSLIAYLMGITKLDPIQYGLLFERFLNKGRVLASLPDIDVDFEGIRRNEVKRYIESKYGESQVCSVGTYTSLKAKAILKDFGKMDGASIQEIEYVNKILDDNDDFYSIIRTAAEKKSIKNFVNKYPIAVSDIPLVFKQPRAGSIHACATLILPEEKTVFEWVPVKKMKSSDGEDILVSEWEGGELEMAGFLKEDILGILQLDKFRFIIDSIKEKENLDIDIFDFPFDDQEVFKYFQKGWNGDVFHFGSVGLTGYCKELQPENINDLTAGISLYRPGAMENNFHNEYILRKEGEREVEYFTGAKEILDQTYGVFVYQEQIMKLCQVLGGLSLVEADDVRKAMVKKKYEELRKYKKRFIPYYVENFKVDLEYAENVWEAIDKASTYLFNKSHATAYTLTGYISQYLKVHYPLHYWACAFSFIPTGKKDFKIPAYISEIHQTGNINLFPPDINKSGSGFISEFGDNSIFWSLDSISFCGEKAVEQLQNDKFKKGEYFSFSEFLERNVYKGSKVGKRIIENLILSGAFDGIEDIKNPNERRKLINFYREEYKIKISDPVTDLFLSNKDSSNYNWWWSLNQRIMCGFALFDYKILCENYLDSNNPYMDSISIQEKESLGSYIVTGGYINEIIIRTNKKGEHADVIIDNNFEFLKIKFWHDTWGIAKDIITGNDKCILLISGKVMFDKYKGFNSLSVSENSEILILK